MQVDAPGGKNTMEQRASLSTLEQTDYYGSSPAHPPLATPLSSQPPPLVGSTYKAKPLIKRASIACVKCRDRKVKCIPVPNEEPPRRCTRCKEKNQPCQYLTVTPESEQRGSQPPPAQTDCYPYYESSRPPATPLYAQPLSFVDSTYPYPQPRFSSQLEPYPTSAQNTGHHNTPPNMYPRHPVFSFATPPLPFPYTQSPSPTRFGRDPSGNYGISTTYQAQSTQQLPTNQQFYDNQESRQDSG